MLLGVGVVVVLVGIFDVMQTEHSILRNYPVIGHMRFLMEGIRPELQQYFIERNYDGRPFDRNTRSSVYQRAKDVNEEHPFGTERDLYAVGYEYLVHSTAPVKTMERATSCADRRPRLHPALRNVVAERERDELRQPERQRHRGPEPRGSGGWLRPRHRRRGDQPLPPSRRRPGLGDRLGLLRLPDAGRGVRRGRVRSQGRRPPGEDGAPQAQPGSQARYRRGAARGEGQPGDRRDPRGPSGTNGDLAGLPPGVRHAARAGALHRPDA